MVSGKNGVSNAGQYQSASDSARAAPSSNAAKNILGRRDTLAELLRERRDHAVAVLVRTEAVGRIRRARLHDAVGGVLGAGAVGRLRVRLEPGARDRFVVVAAREVQRPVAARDVDLEAELFRGCPARDNCGQEPMAPHFIVLGAALWPART